MQKCSQCATWRDDCRAIGGAPWCPSCLRHNPTGHTVAGMLATTDTGADGLRFTPAALESLALDARSRAFVEIRAMIEARICQVYAVPPLMIGEVSLVRAEEALRLARLIG